MYNHTYHELLANLRVSQDDIDFFADMPFVRPYMTHESQFQPVPYVTRYDKGDASDQFFNKTINSSDTIPHALAFMRKPGSPHSSSTGNTSHNLSLSQSSEEPFFVTFFRIEAGANGYIDTAHGGLLAALFDETLGLCAEAYRAFASEEGGPLLTAKLEVSYLSPVETPCTVLMKTWVRRREDRKWSLEAELLDKDGVRKAEAKSLYIKIRPAL